jgi:hypothetical protein
VARLYLLVPNAVVVVGLASMWHALVTLEGVASLTDTPTVIGSDQPLPTTMRYVRIEGAALDESSVLEVRVSHTERSGREILDHTYFASIWQRRGQRFQVHTNAAPRADAQLLGVYHPAERVLVSGPSGATMAGFARNVWIWSAILVESPDAPYSVEIPKDGARFRIARVAGETSARELAAQVNRLLEDANRD